MFFKALIISENLEATSTAQDRRMVRYTTLRKTIHALSDVAGTSNYNQAHKGFCKLVGHVGDYKDDVHCTAVY